MNDCLLPYLTKDCVANFSLECLDVIGLHTLKRQTPQCLLGLEVHLIHIDVMIEEIVTLNANFSFDEID